MTEDSSPGIPFQTRLDPPPPTFGWHMDRGLNRPMRRNNIRET